MSWLRDEIERSADAHAAQRREIEELRKAVIGWKSSYQDLVEKFNQLSKSFRELQERVEGDGK